MLTYSQVLKNFLYDNKLGWFLREGYEYIVFRNDLYNYLSCKGFHLGFYLTKPEYFTGGNYLIAKVTHYKRPDF